MPRHTLEERAGGVSDPFRGLSKAEGIRNPPSLAQVVESQLPASEDPLADVPGLGPKPLAMAGPLGGLGKLLMLLGTKFNIPAFRHSSGFTFPQASGMKNPTASEAFEMAMGAMKRKLPGDVRGTINRSTGDLFTAPAADALHLPLAKAADIPDSDRIDLIFKLLKSGRFNLNTGDLERANNFPNALNLLK